MLVAYPLPGKGYRYPIRRGSGLFIAFTAFGDASVVVSSRIVPRFSIYQLLKVDAGGDEQLAILDYLMSIESILSIAASLLAIGGAIWGAY